MNKPHRPHDEFFKFMFSIKSVYRQFLRTFLPKELLALFDLDTLAPDPTNTVTGWLEEFFSDLAYICKLKPFEGMPEAEVVFATLLNEHKSSQESYPQLQINDYRQGRWRLNEKNKERLTFVLPIFFYHGEKNWPKAKIADYYSKIPPSLLPFSGFFDIIMVDLSTYEDDFILQLRLGMLSSGLLLFKHAYDKAYLEKEMALIFKDAEKIKKMTGGTQFLIAMFEYYFKLTDIRTENEQKNALTKVPKSMEAQFKSWYDVLKEQAAADAYRETVEKITPKIEKSLTRRVTKEVRKKLTKDFSENLKAAKQNLKTSLRKEVAQEVRKEVAQEVRKEVAQEVRKEVVQEVKKEALLANSLQVAEKLMIKLPMLSDAEVQETSGAPLPEIKKMRKTLLENSQKADQQNTAPAKKSRKK